MAGARQDPDSEFPRKRRPGVLRWMLIGLAAVAALGVGAYATLHALVDADYLGKKLTEAVAASDSLYRVDLEAVEFSLLQGALLARNLTLQPDPEALARMREAGTLPAARYHLSVPILRLGGVNLWKLVRHRDVTLRTLDLRRPHLHIETERSPDAAAQGKAGENPTSEDRERSLHAAVARSLPPVQLDGLRVEQGAVSFERAGAERSDSIGGISMQFHNVIIDSVAARDSSRVLFSDDVQIQVAPYRRFSADSLYVFEVGALHGSSREASLTVASMRLAPTVSDEQFLRRQAYRTSRHKISTGPVALSGIDYRRLVEQGDVVVGLLHLDSLRVDVYFDRTLPELPDAPLPKLPHEAFQAIETPLRLDTLRVTRGEIRYSERAVDGTRPGTLAFEDAWGTIYNVTNDPRRMTPSSPAVIDARLRLAGVGRLSANVRYFLLAPHLSMAYRGTLGRTDARAFNAMLVDLEGIRIESGSIDSLWFDVKVDRDVASGALQAIYRDLKIATLDKRSGERTLKHQIETFIANHLKVRSENVPEGGDPPRVAIVRHERKAEDPIFKFIWESLRDGLLATIGLPSTTPERM